MARGGARWAVGGVASAGVFKPGAEGFACSVGAVPLEVRARALRQPPHGLPWRLRACVRGGPSRLGQRLPGRVSPSSSSPFPVRLRRGISPRPLSGVCVWRGGVPPARAPSLPAPGRRFAALPSGCVPAAPGGRRPAGSAASEDLPLPGSRTRAVAAPFPAGAPGAPAPLPLQAAAMDEKYLPELMAEKDSLDPSFTHALRLVNQGEGRRSAAALSSRRGGRAGVREGRGRCAVRGRLFAVHRSLGLFVGGIFLGCVCSGCWCFPAPAPFPWFGCGEESRGLCPAPPGCFPPAGGASPRPGRLWAAAPSEFLLFPPCFERARSLAAWVIGYSKWNCCVERVGVSCALPGLQVG